MGSHGKLKTTFLELLIQSRIPIKGHQDFVNSKEYQNNGKGREKSLKIHINSAKSDGQIKRSL